MTYELIGTPRIEPEYSDQWETTMVCDVRREDGVIGDVWIVAGVPDYHRGSAEASGVRSSFENVRVFDGGSVDTWCPRELQAGYNPDDYSELVCEVLSACATTALAAHRERTRGVPQ